MVGRTLAHYEVIDRIGAGGMGVVYRARDSQLQRLVALKVVGEKDHLDAQAQARLMREARTASVLNHPNICTIYGAGVVDGVTYFAMELVEGQPLSTLAAGEALPADTMIRYGTQIADALAHAHERGVIHRDLKCSNTMITPSGQLKVLDFGLAKREVQDETRSLNTMTETGAIMGTLPYMAPEILRGEPANARTDLWALGVMLYRALSGTFPFSGGTGFQISAAIQQGQPAPLPHRVPAGLAVIVCRLLAKDPGDRYLSAAQVRQALVEIQAPPPNAVVPGSAKPGRRSIWIAGLLGVGATAAGLGFFRVRNSSAPPGTATLSDGYRPSSVARANEYYERALIFGPTGARAEPQQMLKMLERALEADPKFAAARALHAWSSVMMLWGGESNDTTLLYKAEEGARRALADDPHCGQAYTDLAVIHMLQGRKELFPVETNRALEINPRDARVQTWRITYDQINGDSDRAVRQARSVLARAPMQWPPRLYLGEILREQGDPDGAIREVTHILDQEAGNLAALGLVAQAQLDAGRLKEAREVLERAPRRSFRTRPVRALLLALEDRRDEALMEMDADVQTFLGAHAFVPLKAAEFYAVLGDSEQALDWLDRAIKMGDDREAWMRNSPHLARIRNDARFEQMLASVAYRRAQRAKAPQ